MKVWYTTIWDTNKNYGKAINDFCDRVPNKDWICVMDGDAMFLTDYWGKQIEDIIASHGDKYQVYGATMNRLGMTHQLHQDARSENSDIRHHMDIASGLAGENWGRVKEVAKPIAAACMFFSKKTWEENKFHENTPRFDIIFSHEIRQKGGKLAVCIGLYVFHKYRLGKNIMDTSHLKNA